jgi:hypothetical protein
VPIPPLNQPAVLQQEQPVTPAQQHEGIPSLEASAHQDNQQPAISSVKPETIVINQLENIPVVVEPLPIQQEKPKQLAPSKTVKNVASTIDKQLAIKPQTEAMTVMTVANTVQKQDNKAPETTNMAERLWAKQEQLKQAELSKMLDNLEPPTTNNLATTKTPQQPINVEQVIVKPVIVKTETTPKKPKEALVSAKNYFTLQLMVLSKQASANSLLKKYPAMRPDFRVVQAIIKGQEKFVLNYGAYPDVISANKARLSLPFEFRNALVRKISSTDTR